MGLINKIKEELINTLFILKAASEEPTKFESNVFDETQLNISDKAVGGKVELINSDGTLSPMSDGEYQLSEGTQFSVKDGLITSWAGNEATDHTPTESVASEKMAKSTDDANTDTAEKSTDDVEGKNDKEDDADDKKLIQLIPGLMQAIADLKAELDTMKQAQTQMASQKDVDAFAKVVSGLNETIVKLANMPAEFSKTNSSPVIKDSNEQKVRELARMLASNKQ